MFLEKEDGDFYCKKGRADGDSAFQNTKEIERFVSLVEKKLEQLRLFVQKKETKNVVVFAIVVLSLIRDIWGWVVFSLKRLMSK